MKYHKLGNTDLIVSEIGLGTWGISGNGYGPVNKTESKEVIHEAINRGINFIDTADSYGFGHSEKLIGEVLHERGDKKTIIATKFGLDFYDKRGIRKNLNEDYIRLALDKSLKRLRRDYIDLYLVHNCQHDEVVKNDVYETLDELKKEGKIRHFGISLHYYLDDGFKVVENGRAETIQTTYNLINQEADNILRLANENSIGLIVREPLANGLLSGKYNINSNFHRKDHRNGWKKEILNEKISRVNFFKPFVNSERSLAQVAISYILKNNNISTVIPGAKTKEQLIENISASNNLLDPGEIEQIRTIYNDISHIQI